MHACKHDYGLPLLGGCRSSREWAEQLAEHMQASCLLVTRRMVTLHLLLQAD